MKKKLYLSLAGLVAISLAVVGMSAFEAHIINVTATIENALSVPLKAIDFGTIFPQEELDREVNLATSGSFQAEKDADGIEYVIKQKPKCIFAGALNADGTLKAPTEYTLPEGKELYGLVTEGEGDVFICEDERYKILPLLCPYLSKHDADPLDQNDYELDAFHGPVASWTNLDSSQWAVNGRLAKSEEDIEDLWNIDLKTPCFEGQCAQDWADFVKEANPLADPKTYVQPANNEHKLFGCDLWIEVTGINRLGSYTNSLTLENKDENYNWMIEQDDYKATLLYNDEGTEFSFKLTGKVMTPGNYYLIYYADPYPGNNPGAKIADVTTDASGNFMVEDSVDLNMDLPTLPDTNFPGAKVWLVPTSDYTPNSMTTWNPTWYLYEYQLINYTDTNKS